MQTDINNIQHVPLRSLQSSCSHWAESSKYELWSWEHSGSQDWVEHASWPGCSHPPLQGQLELDCSWTFFRLIPDQEEEDGQKGENATAADGARQKHDFSLRPKKDIMHVMFSETLVEWSVCSMFTCDHNWKQIWLEYNMESVVWCVPNCVSVCVCVHRARWSWTAWGPTGATVWRFRLCLTGDKLSSKDRVLSSTSPRSKVRKHAHDTEAFSARARNFVVKKRKRLHVGLKFPQSVKACSDV